MTDAISMRLHWLDVFSRVIFKLSGLAYCCQHGSAPPYLAFYFVPIGAIERRTVKSSISAAGQLYVPRTKTVTFGPQGIFVSPAAWNHLPVDLQDLNLPIFRKKLKLHLFNMTTVH